MILKFWTKIVESFKQTIIIQYDIREIKFMVALKEKKSICICKTGQKLPKYFMKQTLIPVFIISGHTI